MLFPIILCQEARQQKTLTVNGNDFHGVMHVDMPNGRLDCNVKADGRAALYWILAADGKFFNLRSQGLLPHTPLSWLRLKRRRERFAIDPAQTITAGELMHLIHDLQDPWPEAPQVADLTCMLAGLPADQVIDRAVLSSYLGE